MTRTQSKLALAAAQELLKGNPAGLREIVRAVLREILEAGMTDALGAPPGASAPQAASATGPATTAGP